ncbi:hypothetical protein WN51_09354 [Melipona quadrifasciata]|uniref:Uncharacterized protein n=1 Tax=Melipona quadrifasciata TaxID=166423 RepID=A0A0M9A7Y1_9HYME|nr:hypothetical protein WN51_09354 [Melipona quadrifasciata]
MPLAVREARVPVLADIHMLYEKLQTATQTSQTKDYKLHRKQILVPITDRKHWLYEAAKSIRVAPIEYVDRVMQIQVFRTMASTTSAAQIPMPQQRYPFLAIRSLSDSITFACSSPQDSGSVLVPISLLMSFSLMPMTVTADQMGTAPSAKNDDRRARDGDGRNVLWNSFNPVEESTYHELTEDPPMDRFDNDEVRQDKELTKLEKKTDESNFEVFGHKRHIYVRRQCSGRFCLLVPTAKRGVKERKLEQQSRASSASHREFLKRRLEVAPFHAKSPISRIPLVGEFVREEIRTSGGGGKEGLNRDGEQVYETRVRRRDNKFTFRKYTSVYKQQNYTGLISPGNKIFWKYTNTQFYPKDG